MNLSPTVRTSLASLFLLLLIPYLSACATIVRGSSQDVEITSDPPNARVIVNGQDRGETPTTLTLDTSNDYQITFERDGYSSETMNVTQDFTVGWPIFGNLFSWGIIGMVVDIANGSAYKLKPEQVKTALEETSASIDVPENSDLHIALLPKKQVEDVVDLSDAVKTDLSFEE